MDSPTWGGLIAAVATVGAAGVAVLWPELQRPHRRRWLKQLIRRELEEIAPAPAAYDTPWNKRMDRRFFHREMVRSPADHADLLLSLEPELTYTLTQLWESYDGDEPDQFLYFLGKLAGKKDGENDDDKDKLKSARRTRRRDKEDGLVDVRSPRLRCAVRAWKNVVRRKESC
jgi:hypothetical protein